MFPKDIVNYIELEDKFYEYMVQIEKRFPEGSDGFLTYLRDKTGFFDLPASTKYHCNYKHGLLEHSLNVTKTLLDLNYFILNKKYLINTCIIVALFHDLGKAGIDNQYPYIYMIDEQKWTSNKDIPYVDHDTLGLVILSKFIDLSLEEIQAIRYHNGQYTGDKAVAMKEKDLTLILHWADMISAKHERII